MTKVLVVDDTPDMVKLILRAVRDQGYEAFSAGDGRRALELAVAELPDVVLLDVMMPGMTGIEVLRRMKSGRAVAPDPRNSCQCEERRPRHHRGARSGCSRLHYEAVQERDFGPLAYEPPFVSSRVKRNLPKSTNNFSQRLRNVNARSRSWFRPRSSNLLGT